jgi:hypothetical protein
MEIIDFHNHHLPARFEQTIVQAAHWPINDGAIRRLLTDAMRQAGLSDADQNAIAAGTCRRLLDIH